MKALLIVLGFAFFSYLGLAQAVTVKNLTVKDGLPSSEVYDVLQDSKGFMWFATDNGVARYDGYEMTVFHTADGLKDLVVFQLTEDSHGRIWFRTFSNRLFYWDQGKITDYEYNDLLVNRKGPLSSLLVDSLGSVWLAAGQLIRIDANGKLTQDSLNLPDKKLWLEALHSANGKIFTVQANSEQGTGSAQGGLVVLYINGKPFATKTPWPRLPYLRVASVGQHLYISFGSSIFQFDGSSLKKIITASGQIVSLRSDTAGNLWVGYYNNGVECFNISHLEYSWRPDVVGSKTVTQIYIDRDGGRWLTTLEGGVFYVPDIAVKFHSYTGSSRVKAVAAHDQEIVVGSYDESIAWIDTQTEKITDKRTDQSAILALYKDSRGNTWFSTARGLQLLDRDSKKPLISHSQDHRCRDFAEDKNGNVWGITSVGRNILTKFTPAGTVLSARTFPYVPVRNMLFADSLIYVATTLGLSIYDTTMQMVHPPPLSLANLKISKMLNLNDTTLLLATIGNGIYVVNKRNWTFEKYNASDRLIADNIYSAEIKGDTLWLGTEKGILVGSVHLLAENTPRFVQFSSSHGLVEDEVDFLVLVNQKVWAFSDRGISVVPITSIYKNPSLPEFYFKKIYVDKKPISAGSTLFLPHDHTNVEMEYGFLSLRNQNITCRYRLSDNEPWTNTNERVIRFASLAPGNYALQIQYSIDNFHWHEADPPMQFVVHPPWWQRWYMHLLALVVTGFIIFIFLRHRYQRINRQQEELMRLELHTLERERNRIAKELHDGVATNLSAIRLMVNRLLRRYKDPLASEVDEHFLSTIKEIKSIIYGLTPSDLEREGLFKGLQHYVERLNRTLPFKIALQVSGDEVYAPGIGLLSFRIIQELLSNSVKHSGASNIYIRLESTPEKLNLMFQDDGVGFTYDDTRGHGLANVQSRIRSVNGSMKFESGPDLTTFIIDLPCR